MEKYWERAVQRDRGRRGSLAGGLSSPALRVNVCVKEPLNRLDKSWTLVETGVKHWEPRSWFLPGIHYSSFSFFTIKTLKHSAPGKLKFYNKSTSKQHSLTTWAVKNVINQQIIFSIRWLVVSSIKCQQVVKNGQNHSPSKNVSSCLNHQATKRYKVCSHKWKSQHLRKAVPDMFGIYV